MEGQEFDNKSIRYALEVNASKLAGDCVGMANARGGVIVVGVEDGCDEPPADQVVPPGLPDQLRKRISQLTVNVSVLVEVRHSVNGGQYIHIRVQGNQQSIASTSDGRFFIRISDETQPLRGDDLGRLMADRSSYVWELHTPQRISSSRADEGQRERFVAGIRDSDRVSDFVKNKSDEEVLDHYFLTKDGLLTNLGILWIGRREDRASLLYPPVVQFIKYDEREQKVRKETWSDFSLNPLEIVQAVVLDVPEWRESYELPDGLFRKSVPRYDPVVIRELLANALVHRPYTQQGDIFINLFADRLEVHNPGLLPVGVTPANILHQSVKRNQHLANVFYALRLMEGEGTGFDQMYAVLLATGRPVPEVREGDDRVTVIVQPRIIRPEIVDFLFKANESFSLRQREAICLGLLAQHEVLRASELARLLGMRNADEVKHWMGRLRDWGLVDRRGETKATEYFIEPEVLRTLEFRGRTSLKGIEDHRLRELLIEDLRRYRRASISQIHERVGLEIPRRKIRYQLGQLIAEGRVEKIGAKRHTSYQLTKEE